MKTIIKKSMSWVLIFTMMLTLLPEGIANAEETSDNWKDYAAEEFAGGNGETAETAFEIATAEQLALCAKKVNDDNVNYSNKYYKLTKDIDLKEHFWTPIGNSKSTFNGHFNGNNKNVKHLIMGTESSPYDKYNYIGLFGYIKNGEIKDLGINVNISAKYNGTLYSGGIVGKIEKSHIYNCYVTGSLNCESKYNAFIGGLVGHMDLSSNIYNSYSTVTVKVIGDPIVGGLVGIVNQEGKDEGNIYNSYATGDVTAIGSGGSCGGVGGLVGNNSGDIHNSYATGAVTTKDSERVGGLVGYIKGDISNSYATGVVTVENGENAGGFGGYINASGDIYNSYATGAVTAPGAENVGGFGGYVEYASIYNSYATAVVTASVEKNVGAFVGSYKPVNDQSYIENCYYNSSVNESIKDFGKTIGTKYNEILLEGKEIAKMKAASGEDGALVDELNKSIGLDHLDWCVWKQDSSENHGYPILVLPVPTLPVDVTYGKALLATKAKIMEDASYKFVVNITDKQVVSPTDVDIAPSSGENFIDNYISGKDIIKGVAVNKFLQVYDVDKSGKVVKFYQRKLEENDVKINNWAVYGGEKGTELFLRGKYLELGISNWGDFGTLGEKPDSFRGTRGSQINPYGGSNSIGMSADHDGYKTGKDIPIDYYLPGCPEERFAVGYEKDGSTYTNTNSAQMQDKNMPTTVKNLTNPVKGLLKAKVVSTWKNKMEITQVISFYVDEQFYRNDVSIKNISGEDWDGARFMRNFDPDNTQFRGGSFATKNTILYTNEAGDEKAVVKAETYEDEDPVFKELNSRTPIFFYSKDERAKASTFGFCNRDPYAPLAYDSARSKDYTENSDTAISMTWDSGSLANNEIKNFIYYTSLDNRVFENVIADINENEEKHENAPPIEPENNTQYTVIFKDDDGSNLKTEKVTHGTPATPPLLESKKGYTFEGWDNYKFYNVTSDLTVTAAYTINQYKVTFDSQGGNEVENVVADYDTTLIKPSNPVRDGYTFEGWYRDEENTNRWNFDEKVKEDLCLYAKWTINKYSIIYDKNGAELGNVPTDESIYTYKDKAEALDNTGSLVKADYPFGGWNSKDDGTGTDYPVGTNIKRIPLSTSEEITLYAHWINKKVSYNGNGNTSGTVPDGSDPNPGDEVTISENIGKLEKSGYTFNGWNTKSDGTGDTYSDKFIMGDTPVIIYAKWSPKTYTVTFKDYDESTFKKEIVEYGYGAKLPENPNRDGYIFAGWDKDFNYVTFDITVTAMYEIPKVSVIFDSQGGNDVDSVEVYKGSTMVEPEKPTREDFKFIGWGKTEDGTSGWNFEIDKVEEAKTLYAIWLSTAPKKTVTSVGNIENVEVNMGTSKDESLLKFPSKITIKDSENNSYEVDIDWNWKNDEYNGNLPGSYRVIGTITLPDGVEWKDGQPVIPEVTATIQAPAVSVTGVSITESDQNLLEKGVVQLSATVQPDNAIIKKVNWSSNDNKIATVDETGKVTAVSPGKVEITVSTVDGAKKDSIIVTVLSTTKTVTVFKFEELTPTVIGSINEEEIVAIVPWGTDVKSLKPTIIHSGASVTPNSNDAQDFTTPVKYIVTAQDGTQKVYNVIVKIASPKALVAPNEVKATATDKCITVNWNKVEGATEYNVYKTTSSAIYTTGSAITVSNAVYNHTFTNLDNGTTYFFVVKAINGNVESAYSDETSATIMTVPDAPQNVTAIAGDKQATISFIAPDSNGGSEITRYIVVSNPDNVIMETTSNMIVLTGLENGTSYTFTVQAENAVGKGQLSAPSNEVKPFSTTISKRHPKEKQIQPIVTDVKVIVNGEEQTAGKEIVKNENGEKTVQLDVDAKTVSQKIDEVLKDKQNPIIVGQKDNENIIEVPVVEENAQKVYVTFTGDIVKKMDENKFKLSIQTNDINYYIPAKEIGIEKVAQILEVNKEKLKEIKVEVKIEKVDKEIVRAMIESAKANKYEMIIPPVKFTIVAKTKSTSGEMRTTIISKFGQYVERIIKIPGSVEPNKITTGIVYNADGTFSHVPTEIFVKDGVCYARINSLTNSDYSVIWNPVKVTSVVNHWSEDNVNDMASRLVIKNPKSFMPDEKITRGDFAEYITKAIGVYRTKVAKEKQFADVDVDDKLADAIKIAVEYNIIKGYPDGTFKPNEEISREEAMVMYARAMDIVKLEDIDDSRIVNYKDISEISTWAYDEVKKSVGAGVFNGRTEDTIAPKGTFTYAEATTAIRNLLIKAKLINK